MSVLTVERPDLELKLAQMGVEISGLSRTMLTISPTTRVGSLGANSGQSKTLSAGHLTAAKIISDVLNAGYVTLGAYSPSELGKQVYEAEKRYGAENVQVLPLTELSGLSDDELGFDISYIFAKSKLAEQYGLSERETMLRIFLPPN